MYVTICTCKMRLCFVTNKTKESKIHLKTREQNSEIYFLIKTGHWIECVAKSFDKSDFEEGIGHLDLTNQNSKSNMQSMYLFSLL
jgi:hypothetical protein